MADTKHTTRQWRYCGQDPIPKGLQKTVLGDFTKHKHTGEPCQCGFIWDVIDDCIIAQVIRGEWGDEYPAIRIKTPGAIGEKAEPYMEKIVYGSVDKATADANTYLMVVAPEAVNLLEQFVLYDRLSQEEGATPETFSRLIEKAENLIAKTEGGNDG